MPDLDILKLKYSRAVRILKNNAKNDESSKNKKDFLLFTESHNKTHLA